MNRRTLLVGASVLGLVAFAGGAIEVNRNRAREAAVATAAPPIDETLLVRPHSPILGPADAKVTLVEFFDPSCEACRAFHPVLIELRQTFPNDLRIVMRYTVFHEGSDEAVRILEAARRQDLFEPVLDALLEEQPGWAAHGAPALDVAWEIAESVGMDIEQGEVDRLFPGTTAVLNQDAADVATLGIQQTPTFFLNGKRLNNLSFDTLRADVADAVTGRP